MNISINEIVYKRDTYTPSSHFKVKSKYFSTCVEI